MCRVATGRVIAVVQDAERARIAERQAIGQAARRFAARPRNGQPPVAVGRGSREKPAAVGSSQAIDLLPEAVGHRAPGPAGIRTDSTPRRVGIDLDAAVRALSAWITTPPVVTAVASREADCSEPSGLARLRGARPFVRADTRCVAHSTAVDTRSPRSFDALHHGAAVQHGVTARSRMISNDEAEGWVSR